MADFCCKTMNDHHFSNHFIVDLSLEMLYYRDAKERKKMMRKVKDKR